MRMCKRRMLSFVLTLALVAGCFAGMGISVKAAGNSILQGTVVDRDGVPVSGVKFQLKEKSSETDIAATITSENGQIEYDVKDLADGQYNLSIASEDYDYLEIGYYEVYISNGSITAIKDWDGKVVDNVKFKVEKQAGPSGPADPAKQTIKIKLVNKPGGEIVNDPDIRLWIIDEYSTPPHDEYIGTVEGGEYTYKLKYPTDAPKKVTIDLYEDVVEYTAEPIVLSFNEKGEIEDYDGVTPREMVVREKGAVDIVQIISAEASPKDVPADGGTIQLSVIGENLTKDNWGIDVESVVSGTVQKPGEEAGRAAVEEITASDATIKISENKTKDKIDFIFSVGPKGEEGNITKQASVKVTQAGKVQDNDKPQNPDDKPQNPDDKPQDPDDKPQTPGNDKPQDDNKPALPETIKVSSIKLSAASKEIAVGKKIKLTTKVFPANATNKSVTYKSSNTKYASVDGTGKVTVKKAGAGKTVTITATAADGSGKSASYKIKIMKSAVKSIKVKAAKSVKAGKKVKAKVTVKTTGKNANKKLKWTSSNTKYATVSSKGVIKTKKAGRGKTVKITAAATDGSGKKSTVKIKIK